MESSYTIPSFTTKLQILPPNSPSPSSIPSPKRHKSSSIECTRSPTVVDLARCNNARFWKSVSRNFKMYFTCFKSMERREKGDMTKSGMESKNSRSVNASVMQSPRNGSYYSAMNEEEKNLNLKSVIDYCKDSMAR